MKEEGQRGRPYSIVGDVQARQEYYSTAFCLRSTYSCRIERENFYPGPGLESTSPALHAGALTSELSKTQHRSRTQFFSFKSKTSLRTKFLINTSLILKILSLMVIPQFENALPHLGHNTAEIVSPQDRKDSVMDLPQSEGSCKC